ncbi:MAG: carbohydrate kinase [Bacteroidetes bacterium]|uniref:Carbohydrate kinase n=1 Tax=Candidatus Cryptobacteroides avicola TaxID=2840757 RepID=A0A940DRQ4_9BACT|nr:carbohydrate kinase [Candidatus Cryptobacteroides avicola]
MSNIVTGIGEVLWDVLPEGKKLGGAPANFAYHVSQFGFESRIVSAIGPDMLGEELLSGLGDKGLDCMIETVPYPTGTVQVELDGNGIPCYDIRQDVAWDNIPFTPGLEALAKTTGAVCFGSLAQRSPVSRDTINRFIDAMPEGSLRIFDINLRQNFYTKDIVCNSMRKCNILKINDEELETVSVMLGLPDGPQQSRAKALLSMFGLKALILTCGATGSHVFTSEETSYIATPQVEVADTVGAGDSFTAAFVSGLLKGLDIRQAHRLAVETSAFVCTQEGAMPELPASLTDSVKVV